MKRNPIFLIAGITLFIAIANLPYGYYQFLRIFICGVSAYGAYYSFDNKRLGWAWVMGIIAVVFNPFLKIHLEKEIWQFVDLISGILFCVYFGIMTKKGEK